MNKPTSAWLRSNFKIYCLCSKNDCTPLPSHPVSLNSQGGHCILPDIFKNFQVLLENKQEQEEGRRVSDTVGLSGMRRDNEKGWKGEAELPAMQSSPPLALQSSADHFRRPCAHPESESKANTIHLLRVVASVRKAKQLAPQREESILSLSLSFFFFLFVFFIYIK